jgi:hypothetical protein
MLELLFDLKVEDDWPPVAVEALPCTKTFGGYRVEAAPLFIKNLSSGDEIEVSRSPGEHVSEWRHLRKSGRTTIWLLRVAQSGQVEDTLVELRRLSCNTVQLPEFGCYAIDVPASCDISEVDAVLAKLDSSQVAVAYPSFRHE